VTKSQLVDAIAARTGLTKKQSAAAIDAALETVEDIHPRTGETMDIAATIVPRFTAGSNLKQSVRK
jgi:DNA-binding protein HU-beta